MNRLPLYIGFGLLAIGLFIMALAADVDFFGDRAARELATARVEIALVRAENRLFIRQVEAVKRDHHCLFKLVEEAYMGTVKLHPNGKAASKPKTPSPQPIQPVQGIR